MLAATIMATTAAAQGAAGDFGAAPVAEVATASEGGGGAGLGQGAGMTAVLAADRSGGREMQGFSDSADQECVVSPAWSKHVDPDNYEFGCKEIEVRVLVCIMRAYAFTCSGCRVYVRTVCCSIWLGAYFLNVLYHTRTWYHSYFAAKIIGVCML